MVDKETEDFFESALRDIDKLVEGFQWRTGSKPSHRVSNDRNRPLLSTTPNTTPSPHSIKHEEKILQELSNTVTEVSRVRNLLRAMPRENQQILLQALNMEWSSAITPVTVVDSPGSVPDFKLQSLSEECATLHNQVAILKTQLASQQEQIRHFNETKDSSFGLDERLRYLNTINRQQKKLNTEELEKKELFMALNQAREELAQLKQINAKQQTRIGALEHILGMSPERIPDRGNASLMQYAEMERRELLAQALPKQTIYVNGFPPSSKPPVIPTVNTGPSQNKSNSLDELRPLNGNPLVSMSPLPNGYSHASRETSTTFSHMQPQHQMSLATVRENQADVKTRTSSVTSEPRPLFLPTMTPPMRPRHAQIMPQSNLQQQLGGSYLNQLPPSHTPSIYWPGSTGGLQQSGTSLCELNAQHSRPHPVSSINAPDKMNTLSSQILHSTSTLNQNAALSVPAEGDVKKYGTMPNNATAQHHEVQKKTIPSAQSEEVLQHIPLMQKSNKPPSNGSASSTLARSGSKNNADTMTSPLADVFRRGGLRATASARLGPGRPLYSGDKSDVLPIPALEDFLAFTTDHICSWLHDLQLAMYVPNIRSCVHTGEQMLALTKKDVEKNIGMKNPMHQKKLFTHLYYISQEQANRLKVTSNFSIKKFLDDIGLLQYLPNFSEAGIDVYVLNQLSVDDVSQHMHITNELHILSLRRGIQVMRHVSYDLSRLKRRPTTNNGPSEWVSPTSAENGASNIAADEEHLLQVALWSHHHVVDWLRMANFPEFAANLRASGVHGALMVLEPRFTANLLASVLNIGEDKSLLRRHLVSEFTRLLGQPLIQHKDTVCSQLSLPPLTVTGKFKKRRHLFASSSKCKNSLVDSDSICPPDVDSSAPLDLSKLSAAASEKPISLKNEASPTFQETSIDDE